MNNLHKLRVDEIFRAGLNICGRSEVDQDWALMKARLGYGNIRLRSAGVSAGVITDFNKSKK